MSLLINFSENTKSLTTVRYEALIKHRFASHVCQTMFTVASETIAREVSIFLYDILFISYDIESGTGYITF